MSPSSLRTARAGFTLIEMMVAISVVAILIGVAAPGLRDFMLNVRLTGYANDLLTTLMLARSEATKRDVRVSVCARKKNHDGECANGQQWNNGWMVVIDANGDGNKDSGTVPLKLAEVPVGLDGIKNGGNGQKGAIVFTPIGINESGPGTITMCDTRGKGRAINVSATGRASITKIETGCTT
jgi:type IV fimbrial biogenesis protein FimT